MSSKEICFYYGSQNLDKLAKYKTVILQASHYTSQEINDLSKNTRVYAYLSLGEDSAKSGPWQKKERNRDWDTAYVDIGSSLWQAEILNKASSYFAQGFQGLFLDTLDAVDIFPEYKEDMLLLICRLKQLAKSNALIANRGFSLLPDLEKYIEAIVFESFSSIWQASGKCRSLKADELAWTKAIAQRLQASSLEVYTLDYADSVILKKFVQARAKAYGFKSVISNQYLTKI